MQRHLLLGRSGQRSRANSRTRACTAYAPSPLSRLTSNPRSTSAASAAAVIRPRPRGRANREALEDRGSAQELDDLRVLVREHLFGQIREDRPLRTARRLDRVRSACWIGSSQCLDEEPRCRRPTAGDRQSGVGEPFRLLAERGLEQRGDLIPREREFCGAELEHLAAAAQPGDGEAGLDAGDQEDVEQLRRPAHDRADELHAGRIGQRVEIVDHQHHVVVGDVADGLANERREGVRAFELLGLPG